MKKLIFLIFITLSALSYSQETTSIQGVIIDGELYNEPLLMANVTIKNTEWNTHTNFNGNFEIADVTPGNYTLQVRFLGYEDFETPITVTEGETTYVNCGLKAKTLAPIAFAELKPSSK